MKISTIRFIENQEEPFDCECCGTCYPTGFRIEYDGDMIWEKYSDGHMSVRQTEGSILDAILAKYEKTAIAVIEEAYTEEKRIKWTKKYLGNNVSATAENWNSYAKELKEFVLSAIVSIRENCENLPYSELLAIKMIALWIESETGQQFSIKIA